MPDKPPDAKDSAALYQATQKQRYLEREVRSAKREAVCCEASGDAKGFEKASLRVKQKQAQLKAFADQSGLVSHSDRVQVFGYNRRVAGNVTAAAKRKAVRDNYLQSIKPALLKVTTAKDTLLQSTVDIDTVVKGLGSLNGALPKGTELTNVRVIAGYEVSTTLRNASVYVKAYGGEDFLWSKRGGIYQSKYFQYDVHWIELNGMQYDHKLKGVKKI